MEFDTLNPADLVLLISAVTTTDSGISYDPGWWWGYWGWRPGVITFFAALFFGSISLY